MSLLTLRSRLRNAVVCPRLPVALAAVVAMLAIAATPSLHASQIHTIYTNAATNNHLFDGGPANAHSYRLPSIVRAQTHPNTLIAFAECRQTGNEDYETHGKIVCRISTNNGTSWGSEITIAVRGLGSYANPTAVTDTATGRIWLFFDHIVSWVTNPPYTWQHGDKIVNICYSDTEGQTWSTPVERPDLSPSSITQDYVGPSNGIQTSQFKAGRLIIPAYLRNFYSDDHGVTWSTRWLLDPAASPLDPTFGWGTEASIVECYDGALYRNDRAANAPFAASHTRVITYGTIDANGVSDFDSYQSDPHLPDPQSEGSILRYNMSSPDRIIFLNSGNGGSRRYMTARISYNQGLTWGYSRSLVASPGTGGLGGYSAMAKTNDFCIGALIEFNEDVNSPTSHRSIDFHKFNLEWIRNGATLEPKY